MFSHTFSVLELLVISSLISIILGLLYSHSNAQKIVEAKQRRIDGAHKALQLLRSTCIVWPNSGSEVLLAGSFDGWTSQVRYLLRF